VSLTYCEQLRLSCASAPPQRLRLNVAACLFCGWSTPPAALTSASLELPCPTAFSGSARPSSPPPVRRGVWEMLPVIPDVPPSGFGYPLGGVSKTDPRRSFSTTNAHGLRPSELFSISEIDEFFRTYRPPSRFSTKPSSFVPAPRRLYPSETAGPLRAFPKG
jgi:hypothetical protein